MATRGQGGGFRLKVRTTVADAHGGKGAVPAYMTGIGRKKQVRLGGFTRASLEQQASARGITVGALLHQAIVYYAADSGSGRPGRHLPRFASSPEAEREDAIEVELSDEDWATLAEEAEGERGANEERMLEHVVLYYMADVESGRIAARILRSLGDPPEETD